MTDLSIGEVARRAGLRPSALRYYESAGLLPRPRRVNGRRRYGADVLARLAVLLFAREAGFSVAEIRTLLHGFDRDTPPPVRWRNMAGRKVVELDALIARAQAMKALLARGLACECLSLEECGTAFAAHQATR